MVPTASETKNDHLAMIVSRGRGAGIRTLNESFGDSSDSHFTTPLFGNSPCLTLDGCIIMDTTKSYKLVMSILFL